MDKEKKELIPWCECTFMDVDVNTYNKFVNRAGETPAKKAQEENTL